MTSVTREALIVADASPLIGLAKINRLRVLSALADSILIPRTVWREVVEAGGNRPEVASIAAAFAASVASGSVDLVANLRQRVDPGEAEAIALARGAPGCLLLIDDSVGRAVAESYGVRCIGTAGLLLRARKMGLIESLRTELELVQQQGLYLHRSLVEKLLAAAGELP